ncbi:response regulator [Chitinispirillales bacterium ANBcel5]|uniref:HD domain-containing phosphohydrolase n=1 Tax=Cellulosispirillum alkaliphilum TaxID=3039283 RepID=UPI002A523D81|nr:response regulator [Chitinispirillales bacterium ANBcel5]
MIKQEEQTILIVDDDQLLCSAIATYLSKAGYKPILANNGTQALHILEHTSPNCIIIDLYMPSMNGIELLEVLKENNNSIPIIITTGHPDMDSAIKAIQNGAYDYIIKPFKFEEMLQKVNQALNSTKLVRENYVLSELASLHEITGKLTTTHKIEDLLDITFEHCLETAQAVSGSIQLYDKESDELVIVRQKGIGSVKTRSSLDEMGEWTISKWVFKSSVPILIGDSDKVPGTDIELKRKEISSSISVPLKVGKEVIGVVNLNRKDKKQPFSAVDLSVIDVLASQASIAINNAFLYTSINQKLDELSLISTYSEQLMGLVDRYDVIGCLFETVKKHFHIDFIGFLFMQKRNYEFLHWGRGEVAEENVETICERVLDEHNKNSSLKAIPKKVIKHHLDLKQERPFTVTYPFTFEHIIPVSWEDLRFGTIYFASSREINDPAEKISLLSSLVSQTRIALTNSKLYNDMKENYIRTIKALAIAVDAKDTYTHGHSENVMNIAEDLAREMELEEKHVGIIRDAGLLHDIGKIGIPGYILNKPGPLTYEEFNGIMKTHSSLGANIVKDVPFLQDLHNLILYHHEHYNGAGYPEGLKQEQIPIGARILHVADAYEAMTSNRPYRNSLGKKEAVKRLVENSGRQFDPQVVEAFLRIAEKKRWIDGDINKFLKQIKTETGKKEAP